MRRKERHKPEPNPVATVKERAAERARAHLPFVLSLSILKTVCRVVFAAAFAVFVASAVVEGALHIPALCVVAGAIIAVTVLQKDVDHRVLEAEHEITQAILNDVEQTASDRPAHEISALPLGAVVDGATRQPGAVACLVVSAQLARKMLVFGPLFVASVMATLSWQAALLLVLSMPVMIALFVVAGRATGRRTRAQEDAMGRLATQFADKMRCLPTILANDAMEVEAGKLHSRMQDYGAGTSRVLSLAFLNSAVLDLFSSMTLATLATLIGLTYMGVLNVPGFVGLEAWHMIFLLLLVPEFFAPFRRFSEGYHLKAQGEAAADTLHWVYEPFQATSDQPAIHGCRDLVLRHGHVVGDVRLPTKGLIVITGPSGSGKTTLLQTLAGVDAPLEGAAGLSGAEATAWVCADAPLDGDVLGDAILPRDLDRPAMTLQLPQIAGQLNLTGDPHLPQGLDTPLGEDRSHLSGGQRMRAVLARAVLSGRTILADEPTAKLDAVNADAARRVLRAAAANRLVIAATHDEALRAMADDEISMALRPCPQARASA